MKRREFIARLASAAVAWPLVAQAQQMRRLGVLIEFDESDREARAYLAGVIQELAQLGWSEGRNLRIDVRWTAGNVERMRMFAKELVSLQPDVILASSTPVTAAVREQTQTIPIVFVVVADPVNAGFVASLARPGGNLTGLTNMDASLAAKWLELLTEIAPGVRRAAIMFNPDTAPGGGFYFVPAFEAAARSLNVEPIVAPVRSETEIDSAITSLAREPRGGLVVEADGFMVAHRAPIIALAGRNNVPAVYPLLPFAREGGLLSYGTDLADIWRRAAPYIDRILGGAKPAELPVQFSVKFVMALNARTAQSLGLTVPQSILLRADEVIE